MINFDAPSQHQEQPAERNKAFPVGGLISEISEWLDEVYRKKIFKLLSKSGDQNVQQIMTPRDRERDDSAERNVAAKQINKFVTFLKSNESAQYTPARLRDKLAPEQGRDYRHHLLTEMLAKAPETGVAGSLKMIAEKTDLLKQDGAIVQVESILNDLDVLYIYTSDVFGQEAPDYWNSPGDKTQAPENSLQKELLNPDILVYLHKLVLQNESTKVSVAAAKCLSHLYFIAPEGAAQEFGQKASGQIGSALPTMNSGARDQVEAMLAHDLNEGAGNFAAAVAMFIDKVTELTLYPPDLPDGSDRLTNLSVLDQEVEWSNFTNAILNTAQRLRVEAAGTSLAANRLEDIINELKKNVTGWQETSELHRVLPKRNYITGFTVPRRVELVRDLITTCLASGHSEPPVRALAVQALTLLAQLAIENEKTGLENEPATQAAAAIIKASEYGQKPSPLAQMRPEHVVWLFQKIDTVDNYIQAGLVRALFQPDIKGAVLQAVVESGFDSKKLAAMLESNQILLKVVLDRMSKYVIFDKYFQDIISELSADKLHNWYSQLDHPVIAQADAEDSAATLLGDRLAEVIEVPDRQMHVAEKLYVIQQIVNDLIQQRLWNLGNLDQMEKLVDELSAAIAGAQGKLDKP